VFSHEKCVQRGQPDKNVGPVVAGNHILVVVNRRKDAAEQNVGLHEAALAEQKLIAAAAAVDLCGIGIWD
jgi:hypothetical protein